MEVSAHRQPCSPEEVGARARARVPLLQQRECPPEPRQPTPGPEWKDVFVSLDVPGRRGLEAPWGTKSPSVRALRAHPCPLPPTRGQRKDGVGVVGGVCGSTGPVPGDHTLTEEGPRRCEGPTRRSRWTRPGPTGVVSESEAGVCGSQTFRARTLRVPLVSAARCRTGRGLPARRR